MVNCAREGQSQGKLWMRLQATLTRHDPALCSVGTFSVSSVAPSHAQLFFFGVEPLLLCSLAGSAILGSGNVTAISVVPVFEEVCTGIRLGCWQLCVVVWRNSWICHRRTTAKTFAKDVFIDQERRLRD